MNAVQPLLSEAAHQLQATIIRHNNDAGSMRIAHGVVEPLLDALREQLLLVLVKPLTLELHIAKMNGELPAETSAERFRQFTERLLNPIARESLFTRYPVLLKHCRRISTQWQEAMQEFLQRTAKDMPALAQAFGVVGPLVDAQVSSGDAHQQGRRVIVATFANGQRLVYKPRPLQAALRFQQLLRWLNVRGLKPQLDTFQVLDAGVYGWSEFVATGECQSMGDVTAFYRRVGALLAVLHAFRVTDAHFENLIARGPHPVLIDIETVLQPNFALQMPDSPRRVGLDATTRSVLMVGLLPSPAVVGSRVVDMSGLGARPDQPTQLQTLSFDSSGSDDMRIAKVPYSVATCAHLPSLDGQFHVATDHVESLVGGFSDAYRQIAASADAIAAPGGPLSAFEDCQIRVLLRPTATYAALLQESHHPTALSDGTEADLVLGQIWSGAAPSGVLKRVVAHEFTQLQQGDIPYFSCRASSSTLTSSDEQPIDGVLSTSGIDAVRDRLHRMNEVDLRLQEWIIRASLASLGEATNNLAEPHTCEPNGHIANSAASAMDATSLTVDGRASWLTLAPREAGHDAELGHEIAEVGLDLYDGLAGIGFFLFAYARHTADERARLLGRCAFAELDRRVEANPTDQSFGAFNGLAGILYAYAHVSSWFPDEGLELRVTAASLLPAIDAKLRTDPACDLISGRAGALLCLLAAHRAWGDDAYLNLAVRCGRDLTDGLGHPPGDEAARWGLPYRRGMSHGYAGIAMALARLGAATREKRFIEASLDITRLECDLVSNNEWTDPGDEHHAGQATWCHGAPGIAVARLVTASISGVAWVENEARRALTRCLDSSSLDNDSLCHGTLGNLDALAHAAGTLSGEPYWAQEVARQHAMLAADIAERGLRCARPHYIAVPGLMTGLAGIGYGALRLIDPTVFPSVLSLAPPSSREALGR